MVPVRTLRKRAGLRQTDLAQLTNVSQPKIAKIESGLQRPSVELAKRIAAVLGFDWTEFFKETA